MRQLTYATTFTSETTTRLVGSLSVSKTPGLDEDKHEIRSNNPRQRIDRHKTTDIVTSPSCEQTTGHRIPLTRLVCCLAERYLRTKNISRYDEVSHRKDGLPKHGGEKIRCRASGQIFRNEFRRYLRNQKTEHHQETSGHPELYIR